MFCPLCSEELASTAALDNHLRHELDYAAWHCRLCPVAFLTLDAALAHSRRRHPSRRPALLELADETRESRIESLIRSAAFSLISQVPEETQDAQPLHDSPDEKLRSRERSGDEAARGEAEPLRGLDDSKVEADTRQDANDAFSDNKTEQPSPAPICEKMKTVGGVRVREMAKSTRGRPCGECGSVVGRFNERDHALRHHSRAGPAGACRLCNLPFTSWRYTYVLRKHLATAHSIHLPPGELRKEDAQYYIDHRAKLRSHVLQLTRRLFGRS